MANEPKLTAYIVQLKPANSEVENSNRNLFRHMIGDTTSQNLADTFIFTDVFRKFITALDTEHMFSDNVSKKCMTANQVDIESDNVNTTIRNHSEQFIIEGTVEGGPYGRKRKKTSTENKNIKEDVSERDAITEDFYFLFYAPLASKKSILLVQSNSGSSIDGVMKKFWKNFLTYPALFNQPSITRYVPHAIIEDFKNGATVSNFTYTTEVPGETLLHAPGQMNDHNFKVTIKIEPVEQNISMNSFADLVRPLEETSFSNVPLSRFRRRKGTLKDTSGKTTPFEMENDFDIMPSIVLSRYIAINHDESDLERIKDYCFRILETIKQEVFLTNAVQER